MATKTQFSWLIWVKKIGFSLAYVLVSGIIVLWSGKIEALGLIPLLVGLQNILKHKFEMSWL